MNEVVELLDGRIRTEWVRPNQKERSKLGRMESGGRRVWGGRSHGVPRARFAAAHILKLQRFRKRSSRLPMARPRIWLPSLSLHEPSLAVRDVRAQGRFADEQKRPAASSLQRHEADKDCRAHADCEH